MGRIASRVAPLLRPLPIGDGGPEGSTEAFIPLSVSPFGLQKFPNWLHECPVPKGAHLEGGVFSLNVSLPSTLDRRPALGDEDDGWVDVEVQGAPGVRDEVQPVLHNPAQPGGGGNHARAGARAHGPHASGAGKFAASLGREAVEGGVRKPLFPSRMCPLLQGLLVCLVAGAARPHSDPSAMRRTASSRCPHRLPPWEAAAAAARRWLRRVLHETPCGPPPYTMPTTPPVLRILLVLKPARSSRARRWSRLEKSFSRFLLT